MNSRLPFFSEVDFYRFYVYIRSIATTLNWGCIPNGEKSALHTGAAKILQINIQTILKFFAWIGRCKFCCIFPRAASFIHSFSRRSKEFGKQKPSSSGEAAAARRTAKYFPRWSRMRKFIIFLFIVFSRSLAIQQNEEQQQQRIFAVWEYKDMRMNGGRQNEKMENVNAIES